jgi:hypothetical protein
MLKLKESQVKNELKKLKEICDNFKIVDNNLRDILEKRGYEKYCIGTGKQSYSSSLMISIWELDNSFLEGKFIGVGSANRTYGFGNRYYAYIKEIKD